MKKNLFFVFALAPASIGLAGYHAPKVSGALIANIEVTNYKGDGTSLPLPEPKRNKVVFELPSGNLKSATLTVHPKADTAVDFRIDQQFETSLAVHEGSETLEFTRWHHYFSNWEPMTEMVKNTFRFEGLADPKANLFPAVNVGEIERMAKRVGNEHWAEVAKRCTSPQVAPCSIGISKLRLRIWAKTDRAWKPVRWVEIKVPISTP